METPQVMNKSKLRKEMLAKREALTPDERRAASVAITDRILGHQWFYRCEYFLCYAGYGSEINTFDMIEEALRKEKKVFLPKVMGDYMEFYRVLSLNDLEPGYKGIPEPTGKSEVFDYADFVTTDSKILLIMPGVAFDAYRNRIGYGKGYYDKYLSGKPILQEHSIAIGYKCQCVNDRINEEDTDIKPYQVILV